MVRKSLYFSLFLIIGTFLIISCKPINIFSPLVNPSKMGNDAKLDAGYNALADGNYNTAIDYFTDVIEIASGDDLVDAYLGRGAAYMNTASSNIGTVFEDLSSGDLNVDDTGNIIGQVVNNDEYDVFFDNIQKAAVDYNSAIDNSASDVDPGILLEAYETNMMAATGVGAQKIAITYETAPWIIPTEVTLNEELEAIVDDTSTHPYNIGTWDDDNAGNGLREHVNTQTEETEMMGYLTNAFNALEDLKSNPPLGMSEQDISDMQTGIKKWASYGLFDNSLGIP